MKLCHKFDMSRLIRKVYTYLKVFLWSRSTTLPSYLDCMQGQAGGGTTICTWQPPIPSMLPLPKWNSPWCRIHSQLRIISLSLSTAISLSFSLWMVIMYLYLPATRLYLYSSADDGFNNAATTIDDTQIQNAHHHPPGTDGRDPEEGARDTRRSRSRRMGTIIHSIYVKAFNRRRHSLMIRTPPWSQIRSDHRASSTTLNYTPFLVASLSNPMDRPLISLPPRCLVLRSPKSVVAATDCYSTPPLAIEWMVVQSVVIVSRVRFWLFLVCTRYL